MTKTTDQSFWRRETVNSVTFGRWLWLAGRNDDNVESAAKYCDLRKAWKAGAQPGDYTANKF